MESETSRIRSVQNFSIDIDAIAQLIADTQLDSGEIPWCDGQKTDPWDHIEAAMGLSIGGYLEQARHAFEWFARMQLEDGSVYSAYRQGVAEDKTRDEFVILYRRRRIPLLSHNPG